MGKLVVTVTGPDGVTVVKDLKKAVNNDKNESKKSRKPARKTSK